MTQFWGVLCEILVFATGAAAALTVLGAIALYWSLVFPIIEMPPAATKGEADDELAHRLRTHVEAVASVPHNLANYAALERAAIHIEMTLVQQGHEVTSHVFTVEGMDVRNLEVVLEPLEGATSTPQQRETLVLGAHYDSPDSSPGANDNGTGVAALLEIARMLAGQRAEMRQRVRLVFFVNEEAPYGKTDAMGSLRHAASLKASGERVSGMIALETLGYFSDAPGSQRFPFPFAWIYPDVGNFVAFVGLPKARRFVHRSLAACRATNAYPSIGGIAPGFIEGIDLSDHWAYNQHCFPALMVTDTAPFRNPNYHQRHDLPATVDYRSLARITTGLTRMVETLAR